MKKCLFLILCACLIALNVNADPKKYWGRSFWQNATVQDVQELILTCQMFGQKEEIQKCYDDNLFNLVRDSKNSEIVETIVQAGANVNAQGVFKQTPLKVAIQNNFHDEIAAKLIELGAEVEQDDFEIACRFTKNPKIILLLLKHGAEVNKVNNDGYTPLIIAAQQNSNPEIITTIVEQGANLMAKSTILGQTALHWAISMNKNPQIAGALLDAGADINVIDDFGKKPIDYAKENKDFFNSDVYKRLIQY